MMTTTTLARERNGAALREKLNPYVVSFLGFERALSLAFSAHIYEAHFSTSSVFGVDALFCLSPVLLFFETIPVYLHGVFFFDFVFSTASLDFADRF